MTVQLEVGMTGVRRDGEPAEEPRKVMLLGNGVEMMPKPDGWVPELGALTFWFGGVEYVHKPADRPRAAHKLNLQVGDVVELDAWQDGNTSKLVGTTYKASGEFLHQTAGNGWLTPSVYPKGHRPLFRVISRAAAKSAMAHVDSCGNASEVSRAAEQMPDTKLKTETHVGAGHLHIESLLAEQKPDYIREALDAHKINRETGYKTYDYDAADAKPADEIVRFTRKDGVWWAPNRTNLSTHRYTLTFPAGSNTGTVTREKL